MKPSRGANSIYEISRDKWNNHWLDNRLVTEKILAEIERLDPSIETEFLNLKEYKMQFCDGRE